MEIEIDYNPSPVKKFFISVGLNNKEAISFDFTTKAHRIIKQVLQEKKKFPNDLKVSSEWDTLIIKNRKFIRKYHARWIDLGKRDWVNNEIWETTREKKISSKLTRDLLYYSQLICDNYKSLSKISNDIKKFEQLLDEEILKFTGR